MSTTPELRNRKSNSNEAESIPVPPRAEEISPRTKRVKQEREEEEEIKFRIPVPKMVVPLDPYVRVPVGEMLTMAVFGSSGCGKSTLCGTLLRTTVDNPGERTERLTYRYARVERNGIYVTATVIDTVGSGDDPNIQDTVIPIVNALKRHLKSSRPESSVLWLFYFITHRMTKNDIIAIKMLSKYTNVILLLAKADTYTRSELIQMQDAVRTQVAANNLDVLELPVPITTTTVPEIFRSPYPILGSNRLYQSDPRIGENEKDPRGDICMSDTQICVNTLIEIALFGTPTIEGRIGIQKINQIRQRFGLLSYLNPNCYLPELEIYWWNYRTLIMCLVVIALCIVMGNFLTSQTSPFKFN